MTKDSMRKIKVSALLALVLSVVASNRMSARFLSPALAEGNLASQKSRQFDREQALKDLAKQIAGKEDKPAGEVFKNVQMLKAMPAARLLKVMELGYCRALGVDCTHCHVAGEWEKDDRPAKLITREMMKMTGAINNEYLKKIKELKSPNPTVNCTTCHRGQVKPALNLPS